MIAVVLMAYVGAAHSSFNAAMIFTALSLLNQRLGWTLNEPKKPIAQVVSFKWVPRVIFKAPDDSLLRTNVEEALGRIRKGKRHLLQEVVETFPFFQSQRLASRLVNLSKQGLSMVFNPPTFPKGA